MCLLAICMLHLQYPVWFSVGLSFHFPVRFFFFFVDTSSLKITCNFFSWYSLKHTLYLNVFPLCVLKLGLSPGWPGTWSKQFDCFTSQNAECTGTRHHA